MREGQTKKRAKNLVKTTIKKRDIVVTHYKEGVLTEVFEEDGRLIGETFIEYN